MQRNRGRGDQSTEEDGNHDLRRHSTFNASSPYSHSENAPRPSPSIDHLPSSRSAGLAGPSPLAREFGLESIPTRGNKDPNPMDAASSKLHEPTPKQHRFSLMKFRHASDPQLSTTYSAQSAAPPVPNFPPTPRIITTSPTTGTLKEVAQKRKSKFNILSRSPRTSQDSLALDRHKLGASRHSAKGSRGSKGSQGSGTNLRINPSFDDPGRLSTQSLRGAPPAYGDDLNSALALPISRASESSRSDGSSGDHGIYATTMTTHTVSTTTTFFRLPRRKKDKGPLFPLPVKIPTPDAQSTSGTTPASTSGRNSQSADRPSLGSGAPPLPTVRRPVSEMANLNHASPLPSPSHSTLVLTVSHGGNAPGLHREHSVASNHSTRSTPAHGLTPSMNRRGRSSTMGSLSGIPDDAQDLPQINPSVRTSTSTSGRKSFGDIFNLSHRLRQNSEPPIPRHGSPGGHPGTPGSASSKPNSFSLTREIPIVYPQRDEWETPAQYLERLERVVSRSVIATALSKSNDEFSHTALRRYMRGFAFFGDPIDMAIRKMLMEVELPKETQQIDRVLQSFSDRYHECNPGIYSSPEQAYFLAFSILILHTDIFNKSNKHKMQKPDYIKNTSGEGVADDILGCFYDNIAYTPFIHVEDDFESRERLLAPKARKSIFKVPSSDQLRKSSKDPVDPYNLIIDNKLDTLRPSLKEVMDLEDTYSFLGTTDRFNMALLHQSFSKSGILQIVSTRSRPDAFLTQATISNPNEAHPGVVDIRVAKVGLLWRKDPKKKKTRSPWQEWGIILTNASLYFFRDINWIKSLITQFDYHNKQGNTDHPCTFKPPLPLQDFKPDTLMSTEDAVALQDSSYTKHKHAFQFIRHGKLEEVFLANTELDKNDWLAHLNYAATFRSTRVRMRGHVGFNYETQRDKGLNRMDSSHSSRSVATPTGEVSLQNRKIDHQLAHEILAARRQVLTDRISEANEQLGILQKQLDNQLRNARHLQILAPLQGRTREQIVLAAGRMSARVKWARMDIWRTKCHKEILSLDLDDESRHLQRLKLKDLPPTAASPRTVPSLSQASLTRYDSKSSGPAPISPKSSRSMQVQGPRPPTQSSTEKASVVDSLSTTNSIASQRPKSGQRVQGVQDTPLISAETFEAISDGSFSVAPSRQPSHALLHQNSVTSGHSKSDQSTSAKVGSRLATPTASIIDGVEEKLLKEAGLVSAEGTPSIKRIETPKDIDKERARPMSPTSPVSPDFNSLDSRAKVRRSLHRTLRDSHHGSHHSSHHTRSRKGRDSASTVGGGDDVGFSTEAEGLTRASGSFVVHGKKASVITFGSEWQTMSPEERLKLRKQAHSEDGKLLEQTTLEDTDDSFVEARTGSIKSTSTTTAKSALSRRASDAELEPVNVSELCGAGEQAVEEKTNGAEEKETEKEKTRAGVEWTDFESEQIDEKGEFRRHTPIEQDVSA